MWITVLEAKGWDGSLIELNRILDPIEGQKRYFLNLGLFSFQRKVFRKYGEADTWVEAKKLLAEAIEKTIEDYHE